MTKKRIIFILFISISFSVFSQNSGIKGIISDAGNSETIIGATITDGKGKGTVTDINGSYTLELPVGEHEIIFTYLGFNSQKKKVIISSGYLETNISLAGVVLKEVEIVADVARIRETPVAFSTISPKKIQEELSSRDLPMILNSTPGVYATEQGGGAGDARVTIRGFSQQNVAVLVDGIPVNDMENGQVYWSNWDGIGDITRQVQVQRGLGASKLAVASVGGTMNTITKGIESRMGGYVKQEVGNNQMLKTSVGYNSGLMKGDWGFTLALSRRTGNGFADQTWNDAYSYFFKVQKKFKHQTISLGFNGAPQKHAQRSTRVPIYVIDTKYAQKVGIDIDSANKLLQVTQNSYTKPQFGQRGLSYNPDWGYGGYYKKDEDGITRNVSGPVNGPINYYHKPLLNLNHLWNISDKIFLSTSAYASYGTGGGTGFTGGSVTVDSTDGQLNLANDIKSNQKLIDKKYDTLQFKSGRILRSSNNDHRWYGLLSTLVWKINSKITYTGGIDLRDYTGIHYRKVYDLLGGDYFIDDGNRLQAIGYGLIDPKNPKLGYEQNFKASMKTVGDTIGYYNKGFVKWYGAFNQLEFKGGNWSAFVTVNVSQSQYKRTDYFAKKDLILADTTFKQVVGWGDTLAYDGNNYAVYNKFTTRKVKGDSIYYTISGKQKGLLNPNRYNINSSESKTSETAWKKFLGYTLKAGFNYNLTEHINLFTNFGSLSVAPPFANVFDNTNKSYLDIKNQRILSVEFGSGFKNKSFAANINAYYTDWANKPTSRSTTYNGESVSYNITAIGAIHKGVEFDAIYKILNNLDVEGLFSFGDWRYYGSQKAYIYNQDAKIIDSVNFSANGVHVGNAAQMQLGASARYEPIRNFYIKPRFTYFGKNYADFDPITLTSYYDTKSKKIIDNRDRDSWQMPDYYMLDIYTGYEYRYHDMTFILTGGVINALNAKYLTDAQNGGQFDAFSSLVYFAQGRRYNVGLKILF